LTRESSAGIIFQKKEGGAKEELTWDGVQCAVQGVKGPDLSVAPPDLHQTAFGDFTFQDPTFSVDAATSQEWNYRADETACTDFDNANQLCKELRCTVYRSFGSADLTKDW